VVRTARQNVAGEQKRRPTLDDVAAEVGLSPASVSLVLRSAPGPSANTRRRVLEAATRLGYRTDRAASLLARRRRHLLGVFLDVRSRYHAELVDNIHTAAQSRGYDLVLSTVARTRDEQSAIDTLVDFRCEAVILLGPQSPGAQLAALGRQLPVIVVGRRVKGPEIDVVRSADHDGVRLAVDHLVGLGHRAISYVDGGRGTIAADRRRGYVQAMGRHELTDAVRVLSGDSTESAGVHAGATLLHEARMPGGRLPTAVITYNDRSAIGLMDTLNRSGVDVPDTMSVVGYDDSPEAKLAVIDLTTVNQDAVQQAEHAVTAAVERLDGGRSARLDVVLTPHLVVRGTTAAPP
jgi:DNA-binding LacI/PurR family transcriptional regulator